LEETGIFSQEGAEPKDLSLAKLRARAVGALLKELGVEPELVERIWQRAADRAERQRRRATAKSASRGLAQDFVNRISNPFCRSVRE
jgi:hypothetical protein